MLRIARRLARSSTVSSRVVNRRGQFFRPLVEQLEDRRLLATIVVTGIGDTIALDGLVTLREAITAANTNLPSGDAAAGNAGLDTIAFNIDGTGVNTITPLSALPTITDLVIIDGFTQPGSNANTLAVGDDSVHLIELNGTSTISNGLVLAGGGGSTVRGLVINRFSGSGAFNESGILLRSDNNVIAGNFIGTDATGISALGNGVSGVRIATGANNLIGGTTPAARNVISGNGTLLANVVVDKILFSDDSPPSGTIIRGNYIGPNAAGTAAVLNNVSGIGNTRSGVYVQVATGTIIGGSDADDGLADGNVGARNLISGNTFGILTEESSSVFTANVTILGNFIGVDVTGNAPLANFQDGIRFGPSRERGDSLITVGGTAAGAGNVISSNRNVGVSITNSNVMMQGNRIGTNLAGTLDLGNGNAGVELTRGGSPPFPIVQFTVGGATPAARNIISGNGSFGIRVNNLSGSATVQGNYIGTQGDGVSPLGNDADGIFAQEAEGGATIGGTNSGEGNVIAFNGFVTQSSAGAGITIPSGTGIAIVGNSIFANRGLGIDLFGNSPTPNDAAANMDSDTGPNNLQNFPVLTSVTSASDTTTIQGTLNSLANTTFRIELFASVAADPSGFGEGQTFFGATNVTTDSNGNATFSFANATPTGTFFTATATRTNGENGFIETSEFSAILLTQAVAPTVTINQASGQADPTSTSPILFTVVFSTPVTGFTGSDVSFVGSTVGGTLVASVTGSGANYTVSVTGMSGNGTVIASIPAAAAVDASNTASAISTSTDNSVTFTTIVVTPTVTINQASTQADPTSSGPILFTVVFSTPVTGFTGGDVSFAGSTVGGTLVASVTGSGANYTVSVTGMTGNGTVVVSIPAAAAVNGTTPSAASTSTDNGVTFTTPVVVAPAVTINQAPTQADPATTGPILFTVVFSTPVTGFTASDVSFTGSTVGGTLVASVTGSGANYTVSVTGMTGSGTVVASIPAGAAVNTNNSATDASTSIDNIVTATIAVPQATTLTITLVSRQANYKNEVGLYIVDDAAGRIGTLLPGDAGYARAAIARTSAVFTSRDKVGSKRTVNLPAGAFYGLYLVQNATRSELLAKNPLNRLGKKPLMFFSFVAANPDGFEHLRRPSAMRFAFEDQTGGGDRDFNDSVVEIRTQAAAMAILLTPAQAAKRK